MTSRFHYSAPDRYLRLVLSTDIHESAAGWMRSEVSFWFGDRRLDAATLNKIIGWNPSMLFTFLIPYFFAHNERGRARRA